MHRRDDRAQTCFIEVLHFIDADHNGAVSIAGRSTDGFKEVRQVLREQAQSA